MGIAESNMMSCYLASATDAEDPGSSALAFIDRGSGAAETLLCKGKSAGLRAWAFDVQYP